MAETKGSSLSMRCFCQSEELSCHVLSAAMGEAYSAILYQHPNTYKKKKYELPQNHSIKIQTDQSLTNSDT